MFICRGSVQKAQTHSSSLKKAWIGSKLCILQAEGSFTHTMLPLFAVFHLLLQVLGQSRIFMVEEAWKAAKQSEDKNISLLWAEFWPWLFGPNLLQKLLGSSWREREQNFTTSYRKHSLTAVWQDQSSASATFFITTFSWWWNCSCWLFA